MQGIVGVPLEQTESSDVKLMLLHLCEDRLVHFANSIHEIVEEVMDYRTYCETMAGLLQKPIVKLLRNLKVSRNVKWIYQEGISISGRCSLACFNGKLQ